MSSEYICDRCNKKDSDHLQHELNQCLRSNKAKDQQIKKLDKKVFILMCIVVGIGAVLGKESLDSLLAWLETINAVRTQVDDLTAANIPGPATAFLCVFSPIAVRPRRK
jgi:cell division protein FtsB